MVRQPSMLLDTEDVGSDSASDFDRVLDRAVHSMGSNSLAGHSKSNVPSVKKLKQSTDQCASPVNKRQAPTSKIRSRPAYSDQDEQGSHSSTASPEPGIRSSSETTAMNHMQPISDDCKRTHRDQLKVITGTEEHFTRQNSIDSGLMSPSSFIGLVAAARPTSQPTSSVSPPSSYTKAPAKKAARQIFKQYIKPSAQMRQQFTALQPSNHLNSADSKYVGVRSAAVLLRSGECSPCLGSSPTPSLSMHVAALQAGFEGLAMGY